MTALLAIGNTLATMDPELRKAIKLLVILAVIAVIVGLIIRIPGIDPALKQIIIVVAAIVMILIACDWYL